MKRSIVISTVIVLLLSVWIGYGLYHKPHTDLAKIAPAFILPAETLVSTYHSDETAADAQYLDKIIEVFGTVDQIEVVQNGVNVSLDGGTPLGGVICQMLTNVENERTRLQPGQNVRLRGVCSGMLMDVVLTRCVFAQAI